MTKVPLRAWLAFGTGVGIEVCGQNLRATVTRVRPAGVQILGELDIPDFRQQAAATWGDQYQQFLRELGLAHVEVSDGTIALDPAVKGELISRLAREFTVLAEVGSKDADFIMAPYVWVEQIERDLDAGAWKVIAEARESGTAGIYRADGEVRTGLIDEIVHAVDSERLIFEAPLRAQQVWLLKRFGTECNLGNIAPGDVLSLETLRLGLRSDTVERFALDGGD